MNILPILLTALTLVGASPEPKTSQPGRDEETIVCVETVEITVGREEGKPKIVVKKRECPAPISTATPDDTEPPVRKE